MAGTWPNLDAADLEARVRTYLNEATANFYTQAEIWRWLSLGAKDIAEKTGCVRRVLDAVTVANTRNVSTNCHKVYAVEYIPTSGRAIMLEKITPLMLGGVKVDNAEPQYWYEDGSTIGIEPLPSAIYNLRLHVYDMPKILLASFSSFTLSGGGANFAVNGSGTTTGGTTLSHSGAANTVYSVAAYSITNTSNVTTTYTVSGVSGSAYVNVAALGYTSVRRSTTNGVHSFNTLWDSVNPYIGIHMDGTITIDNIYIYKEVDFATVSDQTELSSMWQHLLVLYAAYCGLTKDKKYEAAQAIYSIYSNELTYLRYNILEIIPDGLSAQRNN